VQCNTWQAIGDEVQIRSLYTVYVLGTITHLEALPIALGHIYRDSILHLSSL
jgi:hypothetical protein